MMLPFVKKPIRPAHNIHTSRPYKVMNVGFRPQPINDENSNCLNLPNKVVPLSKKIKRSP